MTFYHGTSKENWELIQKEGVLYGGYTYHRTKGKEGYRYTYLTPFRDIAEQYGNVTLKVEYTPVGVNGKGIDNYGFNPPPGEVCWQFSVFIPIPVNKVKNYETNFKTIF